jgi:hypothetical protein
MRRAIILLLFWTCHLYGFAQEQQSNSDANGRKPIFTVGLSAGVHYSTLKPDDVLYSNVYTDKNKTLNYREPNWHAGILLNVGNIINPKFAIQYGMGFYVDKFEARDEELSETTEYFYYHVKFSKADLSSFRHTLTFQYALRTSGYTPFVSAGVYYSHIFGGEISAEEGQAYKPKNGGLDFSTSEKIHHSVKSDQGIKAGVGMMKLTEGKKTLYISLNWLKGFGLEYERNYNIAPPWATPQYTRKSFSLNATSFSLDVGIFIFQE